MEATQKLVALNRARDKQLRYSQTYDIINHVPRTHEPPRKERPPPRADSRTSYNIITNMGLHEHHYLPPGKRPPKPDTPPKKETLASRTTKREFDLISNKYVENHEEKDAVDKEMQKQAAAERFWTTREFNPVTCTYYDAQKEGKFQEKVKEESKTWGTKQFSRLPPSVKVSEGVAYNLLTMEQRNEEAMAARARIKAKASKARIGPEVEARVKARSEEVEDLTMQRTLHRVSYVRDKEARKHGYNLLTNAPFKGLRAGRTFEGHSKPPRGAWERAEEERAALTLRRQTLRGATGGAGGSGATGSGAAEGAASQRTHSAAASSGGPASARSGQHPAMFNDSRPVSSPVKGSGAGSVGGGSAGVGGASDSRRSARSRPSTTASGGGVRTGGFS